VIASLVFGKAMSFIRKKVVNGQTYRYEVTSYRDPDTGKVKQRNRYLGKEAAKGAPAKVATFAKGDRVRFGAREGVVVADEPGRALIEWNNNPDNQRWYDAETIRACKLVRIRPHKPKVLGTTKASGWDPPELFALGDRIQFGQHRGAVIATRKGDFLGDDVKVMWNEKPDVIGWYTQSECGQYRFERIKDEG
jgi:hypothetical protein